MPPPVPSIAASSTNCVWMSRRLAPTATRRPIPRVRSRMAISMIARVPIPPTRRETAAMLPTSIVKVSVTSRCVSSSSACVWMVKSSCAPVRFSQ